MASNQNRWINYLTGQYEEQTLNNHVAFRSSSWIKAHSPSNEDQHGMVIDTSEASNAIKRKHVEVGNEGLDGRASAKRMFLQ